MGKTKKKRERDKHFANTNRYLFSELLDDARFEDSEDALTGVCAGGGLLNKKLLINLQMARNG